MTKRQIMARAHEIARTCEGNYNVRLAIGLRQAWTEARLLQAGGSEWKKSGMHRIYFNSISRWYGLELDHYKTGNIASAMLAGEHISNRQAGKIAARLCMSKVWYDINTGRFAGKDINADDLECVLENIRTAARVA